MKRKPIEQPLSHFVAFGNTVLISDLVRVADDIENGSQRLAEVFSSRGLGLVFHGIYDKNASHLPWIVYSEMPERMVKMCEEFDPKTGCPAVQHAIEIQDTFEATSFDYSNGKGFSGKRYLQELRNIGYDEIAVVPIQAGDDVHVFFVGLNGLQFRTSAKEELASLFRQFIVSLLVRFHDQVRLGFKNYWRSESCNRARFSRKEVECLEWCSRGKTSQEISMIIGLSEHTVNLYFHIVCSKLEAVNRTHAVTKALKRGLIEFE